MPTRRRLIPLISDTESQPTPAMRAAIVNAEVGDEQRGEDPTVNRLQGRFADLLGKEAALWFPGGTMCNLVAIKVHTQPADAIIADWMADILRAESAGIAFSSAIHVEPIVSPRGIFNDDDLRGCAAQVADDPESICAEHPCGPRRADPQFWRRRHLDDLLRTFRAS